jgi:hypothetical protein
MSCIVPWRPRLTAAPQFSTIKAERAYCTISTISSVTWHRQQWTEHKLTLYQSQVDHELVTAEGAYIKKFLNKVQNWCKLQHKIGSLYSYLRMIQCISHLLLYKTFWTLTWSPCPHGASAALHSPTYSAPVHAELHGVCTESELCW